MERFLSRCAKYIFEKHAENLLNVCLIFPNRRSGVFFNSYLQKEIAKPVIAPESITINEFISGFSDLQQGEKLLLISELYEVFKKHTGTKETFDEFYFWGEVLLADFNDVDRYLVNAKDLFINIADLKELETLFDYLTKEQKEALARFWGSMAMLEKRENEQKFLRIWQKLYPVYTDFKQRLEENEVAYGGMIYRSVIEDLDNIGFEFDHYYIIGLNALNTCEIYFFKRLQQSGKATFLWDFDELYAKDINNEAGHFMRENLKLFPQPEDFRLNVKSFENVKRINLVAVSSNYGQAQEIPRFLGNTALAYKEEFDNTAVVLADESLLFPALGAIPQSFQKVNVTMGYPVKNSVVYGFLLLLIGLLKNKKAGADGNVVVYHRFVTDVLNHQLLGNVEPEKTKQFLSDLKKKNRITIPLEEINFSELHNLIFKLPEEVSDYSDYFLKILAGFYHRVNASENKDNMLLELIYTIYQAVEKLKAVMQEVQQEQNRKLNDAVYFRLFNQYLGQVSVAFEGEPLSGMQVMGILETRALDFKNLIILGLNENKWPRTFTAPSFIPFNIRKGFGLPGIDEQDAMYAYYFYRLVQRAENITATYSTLKEGINTGELSRFGYQLLYDSQLKPELQSLDFTFSNEPVKSIVMQNSFNKIKALLERNHKKPFSPTALNMYLQCSLRFYFRYIMQLPEPEEVKDEIDSPVFGNIFHETVEKLYAPFVGKVIQRADLETIQKNKIKIENEIRKAIGKHYFRYPEPITKPVKLEGKTVLIFENTKTFINRLLEIDKSSTPFTLESLERNYSAQLVIPLGGNSATIKIGGTIDRVDRINGKLRVLDYKTGLVDKFSFKTVEELFEKDLEKPKKEILQALYYSYLLKENKGSEENYQPAIYSLRKFFDENHSPEIKWNNNDFSFCEVEAEFLENLKNLFSEIFSEETEFYQTPHERICRYCPYNKICQ
ncbi:MAG: PD-(D/E)XK nuclease family protein, partial [Prolixibacteraceae bacterium]